MIMAPNPTYDMVSEDDTRFWKQKTCHLPGMKEKEFIFLCAAEKTPSNWYIYIYTHTHHKDSFNYKLTILQRVSKPQWLGLEYDILWVSYLKFCAWVTKLLEYYLIQKK